MLGEEERKAPARREAADAQSMGPSLQNMADLKSSKFKCQACQVGFNSKRALEKHRKTQEHKAAEKAFLQERE